MINDKVKRLSNFHDLINESAFKVTFLPFSAHFKGDMSNVSETISLNANYPMFTIFGETNTSE